MKGAAMKALAVMALAGAMTFGASGVTFGANPEPPPSVLQPGDYTSATARAGEVSAAYNIALDLARNQCPNPASVSPIATFPKKLQDGSWEVQVSVRCN